MELPAAGPRFLGIWKQKLRQALHGGPGRTDARVNGRPLFPGSNIVAIGVQCAVVVTPFVVVTSVPPVHPGHVWYTTANSVARLFGPQVGNNRRSVRKHQLLMQGAYSKEEFSKRGYCEAPGKIPR